MFHLFFALNGDDILEENSSIIEKLYKQVLIGE